VRIATKNYAAQRKKIIGACPATNPSINPTVKITYPFAPGAGKKKRALVTKHLGCKDPHL
jgi:hypothetical protein